MSSLRRTGSEVKSTARRASTSTLVETLARIGYAIRGVVYFAMGLLAFLATIGKGGAPTDQQGAIAAIGSLPAGKFFLWILLIGLIFYSLWGLIRALFDPLHKGSSGKGLLTRLGFLLSAAIYAFLAYFTYGLVSGSGSSASSSGSTQQFMNTLMSTPLGRIVVGLIGVGIVIFGISQVFEGFRNSFEKQFKTYVMTSQEVKWATFFGRVGTAARGFTFILIGALLTLAALQSNASQSIGFGAAFTALMSKPYGTWLLAILSVGIMAFGIYSMMCALWFRLRK